MSHKVLIAGTAYDVSGGDTLVSGAKYQLGGGKTLVNGAAYDISFAPKQYEQLEAAAFTTMPPSQP